MLAGVREPDEQQFERARRRRVDLSSLRWCVAVYVGAIRDTLDRDQRANAPMIKMA